jgi:hypothetical protein
MSVFDPKNEGRRALVFGEQWALCTVGARLVFCRKALQVFLNVPYV